MGALRLRWNHRLKGARAPLYALVHTGVLEQPMDARVQGADPLRVTDCLPARSPWETHQPRQALAGLVMSVGPFVLLPGRNRHAQSVFFRSERAGGIRSNCAGRAVRAVEIEHDRPVGHWVGLQETASRVRSEEHTSELQSRSDLVC